MRFPQFAVLAALLAALSWTSWSADTKGTTAQTDEKVSIEPRAKPVAPGPVCRAQTFAWIPMWCRSP